MSNLITGAEMVVRALQDQGVYSIFGYRGGAVLPIYDALFHQNQIVHVLHQPIVLGAGPGDADRVAFLERVGADEMCRNLACDADQRDRIHQRVGEAGDGVGRAGAGGHENDADLAG